MSKLCPLPWIHISQSAPGWYRPCCNSRKKLDIPNTVPIDEAFNSEAMRELREQFLRGELPEVCDVCWKQEEQGIHSYRNKYVKKFSHLLDLDKPELKYLDIKFDNKCNLQCRMCNPDSSHQIWKLIDLYNADDEPLPEFLNIQFTSRETRELPDKKDAVLRHLDQIRVLKVTGGEPFLSRDFLEIMDELVAGGHAPNVEVEVTTNGTKFYREHLDRFLKFKSIAINISVDGADDVYDYIRYPFNYFKFLERLDELLAWVESNDIEDKTNIKFSCLVTAYNWLNLDNLYHDLLGYVLEYPWMAWGRHSSDTIRPKIYFDFNTQPTDLCMHIKYLPQHILDEGLRRFKEYGSRYDQINEFEANAISKPCPEKTREFIAVTKNMDKYRSQTYTDLDPLLVEYINEYT